MNLDFGMASEEGLPSLNPEGQLSRAERLFAVGAFAEAEQAYLAVLKTNKQLFQAHVGAARCARARGDYVSSFRWFQAATQLFPLAPGAHLECAVDLLALGLLEEAEVSYREVLRLAPENVQAHAGLGHCARRRGGHSEALTHFQAAAALSPSLPVLHQEIASEQLALGQLDEAEASFREVVRLSPDSAQAHAGLGHCARRRGGHSEALTHFQAAAALSPSLPVLHQEIASEQLALGQLDEAEASFREVLRLSPDSAQAHAGLGHCARRRGDQAAALTHFQAAVARLPSLPGLRLEVAATLRELGRLDEARSTCHEVLRLFPGEFQAYLNLGQIERAAGCTNAALTAFSKAQELNPTHGAILAEMAQHERLLGNEKNFAKYLAKALELDPTNVTVLVHHAELAMVANDIQKAHDYYQRAAAVQPGDPAFRAGVCEALARMGRIDEALAGLAALERSHKAVPNVQAKRISLLRRYGYYYEALQIARDSTAAAPHSFALWVERFLIENALGDAEQVEICLRMIPAYTPQQLALLERLKGMWSESCWRLQEAGKHYEQATLYFPHDAAAHYDLVRTKLALMELGGALVHLRKFCELSVLDLKTRGNATNVMQNHYGQLLDDYRLEHALAETLTQLQSLPPAARVSALLDIVRGAPESTAAAVCLLIALRQSGVLLGQLTGRGQPIPKIIMQFWDSGKPPDDVERIMRSWPDLNPEYEVQRFDNPTAEAWLLQHHPQVVVAAFRRADGATQKADIFRLAWLTTMGGVYADADDRCLKPLHDLIPEGVELVLYQEEIGALCNNFIAAMPNHPALARALQLAVQAINRGDRDVIWLSAGPGLLTRAYAQTLVELPDVQNTRTLIFDRRTLSSNIAIFCAAGYKNTPKHWLNTAFTQQSQKE